MRLYHYTAGKYVRGIRMDGLTLGRMPISIKGQLAFIHDMQHLTSDDQLPGQRWALPNKMYPFDRTEARLTLDIPKRDYDRLFPWSHIKAKLNILVPVGFDYCGGSENWWVYIGRIEHQKIKAVDARRNPIVIEQRQSVSKPFSWGQYAGR